MHELKHSAQLRSSPSLCLVHLNKLSAGKRATGKKTVPIRWRCRGLTADNYENSLDHCAAPKRDCLLLKCSLALFRPRHRRVTIRISHACPSTIPSLQSRLLLPACAAMYIFVCGEPTHPHWMSLAACAAGKSTGSASRAPDVTAPNPTRAAAAAGRLCGLRALVWVCVCVCVTKTLTLCGV